MARQRMAGRRPGRAAGWAAAVLLAALLALPLAARPQEDPGFSDLGGNYTIPAGKTHRGNLKLFKATVTIAGKQEGNLFVFGGALEIPGEVTGNVKFIGNNLTITGKVGGEVDAKGANCTVAGSVGKDFSAKCGTVETREGSSVGGDVDVYAGQIGLHGAIDGDLSAQGGQIELSGSVGKDASLEADVIKIDEKAKIAGNLSHESRVPVPDDVKNLVRGHVERDVVRHVRIEHRHSLLGSFGKWFGLLVLSLLVGYGTLALARRPGDAVLAAMRSDVLRNLGVGFLAFIVIPVAAALSCILIVTIPLAIVVLLLYALAVYLAKIPVAVAAGRWMFVKLGRPEPSQYVAFTAGTVALYVLFAIPTLGWILWFACAFLGLGAMVLGIREWRQARKSAAAAPAGTPGPAGGPPSPEAPPPPPAPVDPPPEAI